MSKADKARIVALQQQVKLARTALERIKDNGDGNSYIIADAALDEMSAHDPKLQLQGLCGHERPTT